MNQLAYKKIEVSNLISSFDANQIESVLFFLKKQKSQTKLVQKSLAGIWENANIDIDTIEKELKLLRKNLVKEIDSKIL